MISSKLVFVSLPFLLILAKNVFSIHAVPINESNARPGIYLSSDSNTEGFVPIMSNISYVCFVKFDCRRDNCNQISDIKWLLPRELREHELTYGFNTSRVTFSPQQRYNLNNNLSFIVKSHMNITNIGAIHNGTYICYNEEIQTQIATDIRVRGRDMRGVCDFDDQCLSGICYKNQCKCEANEAYVVKTDKCEPVSNWNQFCKYDEQCTYKLGKNSAVCLNELCVCGKGYAVVTQALYGKRCLKMANLGDSCQFRDQCSSTVNNTYCSTKYRCECDTGYQTIGNKCIPFKTCNSSGLGDDIDFIRGDCNQNQFCLESLCVCRPNYAFDDSGHCKANNNKDNSSWIERNGWYIVGVLGAFLLVVVFLLAFQLRKYKKMTALRSGSSDPLNRS